MGLEACYGNLEAFSDIFQNLIETQWVMWSFVKLVVCLNVFLYNKEIQIIFLQSVAVCNFHTLFFILH